MNYSASLSTPTLCPVCFENFLFLDSDLEPKEIRPCGHMLCHGCIKKIIPSEDGKKRCPTCRSDFEEYRNINHQLRNLLSYTIQLEKEKKDSQIQAPSNRLGVSPQPHSKPPISEGISTSDLIFLANDGRGDANLFQIAYYLDLPEGTALKIYKDSWGNANNQWIELLQIWRNLKKADATIQKFIGALANAGYRNAAEMLVKHYALPRETRVTPMERASCNIGINDRITDEVIIFFSSNIFLDWGFSGPVITFDLGMNREVIASIERRFSRSDICVLMWCFLELWRERYGSKATVGALTAALRAQKLIADAEKLEKFCNLTSQNMRKRSRSQLELQASAAVTGPPRASLLSQVSVRHIEMFTSRCLSGNESLERLVRPLNLIPVIANDVKCENPGNTADQWLYFLLKWISRNGSEATYSWLIRALAESGYTEAAQNLKSLVENTSPQCTAPEGDMTPAIDEHPIIISAYYRMHRSVTLDWKRLGIHLGLNMVALNNFKWQEQNESWRLIFHEWVSRNGSKATFGWLEQALRDCNHGTDGDYFAGIVASLKDKPENNLPA